MSRLLSLACFVLRRRTAVAKGATLTRRAFQFPLVQKRLLRGTFYRRSPSFWTRDPSWACNTVESSVRRVKGAVFCPNPTVRRRHFRWACRMGTVSKVSCFTRAPAGPSPSLCRVSTVRTRRSMAPRSPLAKARRCTMRMPGGIHLSRASESYRLVTWWMKTVKCSGNDCFSSIKWHSIRTEWLRWIRLLPPRTTRTMDARSH